MSNMYEDITAKNINPLRGECKHKCTYCYVERQKRIFPVMKTKYSGKPKSDPNVLSKTVKGGIRFLCSCNDLFACDVPNETIAEILDWAEQQDTRWWIQTKNPQHPMFRDLCQCRPVNFVLGITLETNRDTSKYSDAPTPKERSIQVQGIDYITIEPIMDFDIEELMEMLKELNPLFVNIGADSGNNNLPEPSEDKVMKLVKAIQDHGIEVKRKPNLKRIAPSLFGVV